MVMKATDKAAATTAEPQPPQQPSQPPNNEAEGPSASESKRLRQMVEFEDLDAPPAKKQAGLKLAKVERYLNGPTPATSASQQYLHVSEVGIVGKT